MDLVRRRHVLHVAAVDERHLLGALADRGPRAVHRGEAAADDDDALARVARVRQAERRGPQVLEAVEHLGRVLARDAELVRVVAADRDDDRVEALVLEVVEREVAAQALVADDLAAEPGDGLVLGLEDLDLRQAVLRDAVAEHPARRRVALEDRHVVAGDQQVVGRGHAGRAGADDGRAAAGLRLELERDRRVDALVEHRLDDLVAGVAVACRGSRSPRRPRRAGSAPRTAPGRPARGRDGNGIVRLKIRVDSRKLASAFAFRKPGMSMWLGHLFWHGGRQ